MADIKIELNHEGIKEMLRSEEAMAICEELANEARSNLGEGYIVTTHVGGARANASIFAESFRAKYENLKKNSILKALGAIKK